MSERLFSVAKVGCYCEAITHSTERRKDGEQKVIQLTLRVDPFDAKLASAVDPLVRQTLFKLGNADPQGHVRKVSFGLGTPRQQLTVWATPDSPKASIALDHVRIADLYARTSKDARGYVCVFKAIFGPVNAKELEYVEAWRNTMAFVTFAEAEYDAALDLDGGEENDAEEDAEPTLPIHEFDTDGAGKPMDDTVAQEPARQRLHSHADGRAKRAGRGKKVTH